MPVKTNQKVGAIGPDITNLASADIMVGQPYRVSVQIEGCADILFHRWDCDAVEVKATAKKGSQQKKTDNIESYLYRNEVGEICIPGEYLRQSIVHAAKFRQDPRSPRKSAMDLFKAGVLSLTPLASLGVKDPDYIHKARVKVQGSITRHRPAIFTGWKANFVFIILTPEYISESDLCETISSAGRLIGVADFRPTYGRFNVVHFERLQD